MAQADMLTKPAAIAADKPTLNVSQAVLAIHAQSDMDIKDIDDEHAVDVDYGLPPGLPQVIDGVKVRYMSLACDDWQNHPRTRTVRRYGGNPIVVTNSSRHFASVPRNLFDAEGLLRHDTDKYVIAYQAKADELAERAKHAEQQATCDRINRANNSKSEEMQMSMKTGITNDPGKAFKQSILDKGPKVPA